MPGVAGPDLLGVVALDELPEDAVDPVAEAAKQIRPSGRYTEYNN
jgi:hypothetical protein